MVCQSFPFLTNKIQFFFLLALSLAVVFGIVVLYLRCNRSSLYRPGVGFQRYEIISQDEDGSPLMARGNGYKSVRNTHAMPSDSENDEGDEIVFTR